MMEHGFLLVGLETLGSKKAWLEKSDK